MKRIAITLAALLFLLVCQLYILPNLQSQVFQSSAESVQLLEDNQTSVEVLKLVDRQQASIFIVKIVMALAVFAIAVTWGLYVHHELKRVGWIAAAMFVLVVSGACTGAAHPINVSLNEVLFAIPVTGSATGAVINGSEAYWLNYDQPGISQYRVMQQWFAYSDRPGDGKYQDTHRIIVVDTTAVTVDWNAPAIIAGQPMPDMSGAFALQTIESAGVYIGAEVIAHIEPADAACYLANYGVNPVPEEDGSYNARSLESVLRGEVRAFIQSRLSDQYSPRSADQINNQVVEIFNTVHAELVHEFSGDPSIMDNPETVDVNESDRGKCITITEFGMRDGNVWENSELQQRFDNAIERQEQLDAANDNATRAYVENSMTLQSAQIQATSTMIAAQSEAEAARLLAEAISENPELVEMAAVEQWDGRLPQYMDSDTILPYVPIPQPTPRSTPVSPQ